MNEITPQQFETLLPLACAWVEEQEQEAIRVEQEICGSFEWEPYSWRSAGE